MGERFCKGWEALKEWARGAMNSKKRSLGSSPLFGFNFAAKGKSCAEFGPVTRRMKNVQAGGKRPDDQEKRTIWKEP